MAQVSPRVKVPAVPPVEFRSLLKAHQRRRKALMRVQRALLSGKKGEQMIEGVAVSSGDISGWQRQLDSELTMFGRMYTSAYNRKRAGGRGRGGPNSGFRLPLVVNDNLIRFFTEANLGNLMIDGVDQGRRLQEFLPFLQQGDLYGVANRSLLTSLFSLYAKVNNLSDLSGYNRDPARVAEPDYKNRQILGADPLMMRYLGNSFAAIRQMSEGKLAAQGVKDWDRKPEQTKNRTRHYFSDYETKTDPATGKKHRVYTGRHPIWLDFYHVFDPANFTYGNFQQIILANSLKKEDVKDNRAGFLGKVDEVAAKTYQAAIENAKTSGRQLDFQAFAQEAGSGVPVQVRAALDSQFSLVQATLHSMPKAKAR